MSAQAAPSRKRGSATRAQRNDPGSSARRPNHPTRGRSERTAGRTGNSSTPATRRWSAPRRVSAVVGAPGRTPFVLFVLSLAALGLVGLVLLNTAVNENAFRLHDLSEQEHALKVRHQQLARDVAQLESPGSLAAAANRLGLVPAGRQAYLELPSGRVIGTPAPATATSGARASVPTAQPTAGSQVPVPVVSPSPQVPVVVSPSVAVPASSPTQLNPEVGSPR